MSDRKLEMAATFVRNHPDDAARVIEGMAPKAVVEVLDQLPEAEAAQLLASLLPQYAAKIAASQKREQIVQLLSRMEASQVVAILRHMSRTVRRQLLEGMSAGSRAASALLLNYSADTVGAWMDARAFTLPEDCLVSEALERLAAEQHARPSGAVFVTSRQRRIRGMVQISKLLAAAPDSPLLSLADPVHAVLVGRATLLSVQDHPVWKESDIAPVVSRSQQFIGTLSHARLRKGLSKLDDMLVEPPAANAAAGLSEVYGSSLFALLEAAGDATGLWKSRGGTGK